MDIFFNILHVASAVFIIGPVSILPMASLRYLRAGDTTRTAASAKRIRLLSWLSLLVVITGFGAMSLADPQYKLSITTPWVLWSLVLYAVALILTLAVVVRTFERAAEHSGRSIYSRAAASSGIATLSLVGVVVLMVWKP